MNGLLKLHEIQNQIGKETATGSKETQRKLSTNINWKKEKLFLYCVADKKTRVFAGNHCFH